MITPKTNRSYLLQTVVSKNGSWNSNFEHTPKQYDDQYFASDRSLKYSVRNLFEQMGKDVLIKRWHKTPDAKKPSKTSEFSIMSKNEVKEAIKDQLGGEFRDVFWQLEDVRHFGMVYDNLALHGVAQISQGLDLYREGTLYNDQVTGRMVFESKSDSSKETRGMAEREFLSEAHFAYDISVNPQNVGFLQKIKGMEHCVYSVEDYHTLLFALEHGPRNVKSTQKTNCFTGFLMRIDLKDGDLHHLGDLQGKLSITKGEEGSLVRYNLSRLEQYLTRHKDAIHSIEIRFEETEIELTGWNGEGLPATIVAL